MSTDTHDLIERLSANVKPVRRLPRAGVRAVMLSVWAIALALGILRYAHEPRPDLSQTFHDGVYLLQGVMMTLSGLMAAYAAFALSVPDTRIRPPVRAALGAATALWVLMILSELLQTKAMPEQAPSCFIGLTMGMSAPLALGLAMMLRSAHSRKPRLR